MFIVVYIVFLGECRKLNDQLGVLRKDLNETKSQVVLAEYKRETDFQEHERKAQGEINSLQHFVHGINTLFWIDANYNSKYRNRL